MNLVNRIANRVIFKFDMKNLKQEERIKYLENECSELRQIVRFLQIDSQAWTDYMAQTRQSFDTQWAQLPEGNGLVTDKEFMGQAISLVEQYTGLHRSWFYGKHVLDAGCGNGRWSYVLSTMGANVTALDQSYHGLKNAENLCSTFSNFKSVQANLLEPLPDTLGLYDLVWSYGVLHHTGNTFKAFKNIVPFVKSQGSIFLMLYGEPERPGEYTEINNYVFHRRAISGMDFKNKIEYCKNNFEADKVHGWFDAVSPRVNDLYRFDEIRDWLLMSDFTQVARTYPSRNLYITAMKN